MFFFNLSLGEFLALFAAASAVVTALYLLDRSRRGVVVATLRFWTEAKRPVESSSRRRIRQWPSLLLQLASIACLIAALSQLRLGSRENAAADHVLILDTSAWMAARSGNGTLLREAQSQALGWVRAMPATDRILVLYADSLATPVTGFETNRKKVEDSIRTAQVGHSALDLAQALDLARRLQQKNAGTAGEIVFAGAGRIDEASGVTPPANLRLLPVAMAVDNVGLRKVGMRQSPSEAGLWNVYVSVRNYSARAQPVDLGVQFGGAPVGTRHLNMPANSEQEAAFEFRTRAAGMLEARIRAGRDSFPQDDRAELELPSLPTIPVTVCSNEPELLRPLLAHPNIQAAFRPTAQCAAPPQEGVVIYDRFAPPAPPKLPALYIEPPSQRAPVSNVMLTKWNGEHPVADGLRVREWKLTSAQVLTATSGEAVVAESEAGPLVLASAAAPRRITFGFHPIKAGMRFELATPLLFANALRWLAPESFRNWELYASSVGTVTVPLEGQPDPQQVKVQSGTAALPFSVSGNSLRFFSGKPGTVRVDAGGRERIYSLTLPSVPDALWNAPASIRRGVPKPMSTPIHSRDIWQWLALLGGLGLLAEWLLFAPTNPPPPIQVRAQKQAEPEPLRRAS